ncbi:MAG: ABC transporter permease [Halolamina sp.]|uniref:ABC transporter permease n=1 Tax=Halolamina sp. TaxID=1940283 RepID=UPI002FC3DF7F
MSENPDEATDGSPAVDDGPATDGGSPVVDNVAGDETPETARAQPPIVRRTKAFAARFRRNRLAIGGLLIMTAFVLVAVLAPVLAPYDPAAVDVPNKLQSPSVDHPFGTDRYGRDMLSRTLLGARIAVQVAVATPLVAMSIGVPIGLVAGYVGGRTDDVLMRLMDAIFAFPTILLGLTLVAVFGQSLTNIILALGIVFIPQFARITRGSAVSVSHEEHVRVARSLGASDIRILLLHVLPFCISAILVQATITAALAIILESSLSFLGVGVPPPKPSWGSMLRVGKGYINSGEWWYSVFPGVAIVISVLGFNLLGDGLRDVLDPRSDPNR